MKSSLRRLSCLSCDTCSVDSKFYIKLGQILPRLKHLKFGIIDLKSRIRLIIDYIRQYCPQMRYFTWQHKDEATKREFDKIYNNLVAALKYEHDCKNLFYKVGCKNALYSSIWNLHAWV